MSGTTWYELEPDSGVQVTLTTCSTYTDFDTFIGVYSGSCNNLTCISGNDDGACLDIFDYHSYNQCGLNSDTLEQTSTTQFVSDGSSYYVGVSGSSHSSGNYALTITYSSNSSCVAAIDIPGDYYTPVYVGGSLNYFSRVGMSVCNGIKYYTQGVWYKINPVPNHSMTIISTNSTKIGIVSGSDCSQCIATSNSLCENSMGDNLSSITFIPTLSEYYIVVASDNISVIQQDFTLNLTQNSLYENSECLGAYPFFVGMNQNVIGNTSIASPLTSSICSYEVGKASWYRVTSSVPLTVTFSTCNSNTNFDTMLSVYGGSCESLYCITYNDDDTSCPSKPLSTVQVSLNAHETVYLVISGYDGETGTYLITQKIN